MNKNILKVCMLGSFKMEYGGREMVLDRNKISKTTQLFQLLMLHTRDGGISKTAIIEALYGRGDVENKNASLNNTIFRLRKQLRDMGLPESKYIKIESGMCCWDENIQVQVDVCEFDKLLEQVRVEKREDERLQLWIRIWKIYQGEFLPDMIGENWVAVENVRCKEEYTRITTDMCKWLKAKEHYEELHRISHRTAEIYPFDEWQIWEIDSLIAMSRFKEGLEVYKDTERRMFEELGVAPSARMLEQFQLMGERTSQAAGAIEDIKERLREKDAAVGAYYCPFPSFVDIYHVFCRMTERAGLSVSVMLCTLDYHGSGATEEKEQVMSKALKAAIQSSIRKGDFYTRYNTRQYIVMLVGINQENCPIVSKRISKAFRKYSKEKKYPQVDFYVASVGEVCDAEGLVPERRTP